MKFSCTFDPAVAMSTASPLLLLFKPHYEMTSDGSVEVKTW